jgi:murein DD-endopeptidase MepM/ murein hydrolase activator NlpD
MSKPRRIIRRRPSQVRYRRKSTAPRFLLILFACLGVSAAGASIYSNFILPGDTQSSVDKTYWEAAADYTQDTEISALQSDQPLDPEETTPEPAVASDSDEELPVAQAPCEFGLTRMTNTIQQGDTPSSLLEGHLKLPEIYALCDKSKKVYSLSKLKAGQPWTMIYSADALIGLEYEISADERLVVSLTESGYEFRREAIPYDLETVTVGGSITSSLFGAVTDVGESEDLAVRLAKVFAYDVDFVRDLRVGDSFRVVVEKKFREGKFFSYGDLLAASFTNQGRTYYAYRYAKKGGESAAYYDQNGRPLRKAFLKSPLPFTRISSGYSMNRMHPILGYRRPHQAIDYAAPTGTPISTVADGTVSDVGSNKSQGKYVKVKHSNGYETIYNHMSKFAKISKRGAKVKQGQVIGYVGSTGYATGPHLDFRMKHNGSFINPLKLKMLPADPIAAKEMPAFKAVIASYKSQLEEPTRNAASLDTKLLPAR